MKRQIRSAILAIALLTPGAPGAQAAPPAPAEQGSTPWKGQLVYGWRYMEKDERARFRAEIKRRKTYDEQLVYWREHVEWMKQRAWERGLVLEEPPEILTPEEQRRLRRPVYAQELMTTDEVEVYREQERALIEAADEAALEAFLDAHETQMRLRAEERGLTAPGAPSRDHRPPAAP